MGRIQREEPERESEKARVKRKIFGEEQREKEMQRALEDRLKRGHQQREANYKGSEKGREVSLVLSSQQFSHRL